jgi:2,4-dienoyl-CoA reductase (NADPH2)
VDRKGVDVRLNTRVTRGLIKELEPEVLVVATGAKQIEPPIEGATGECVVYAWDVLTGEVETGDTVVIVGGGAVGVETATLLAQQGKDVTVLEMLEKLGKDIGYSSRWVILQDAARLGVRMVDSCCVERITPDGVVADVHAEAKSFDADTVVIAVGSRPDDSLEAALTSIPESIEVHKIGDCEKPRKALDAIHEGFNLALEL